ncbi:hypothetical protein [Luteolibacter marinus]|uniref:hypothetical protein n=1 Tax=Luteolibacter marinus TaxID=2776705 RepID=UPI00186902E7|nr:hypothetical protein [Luteolibacter marinus]
MSLHAQTSPEARQRLQSQRRNSTIASIAIAVLSIILLGLVFAFILLPAILKDPEVIVTYVTPSPVDETPQAKKLNVQQSRPSPPSAAAASRVIAANAVSPVSIEIPEITTESITFGAGTDDFGEGGLGGGFGGAGTGNGGGFGSTGARPGALQGKLYDFKQGPDGKPVDYNIGNPADFFDRVTRLQRSNFSESSLRRYFQAPVSLNLAYLEVPLSPASEGPKHFGAEGMIEPSGWIAHYKGKIVAPKDGTYRFSGIGDDYVVVMVNKKMRLAACRPDTQGSIVGRWEPTEPTGKFLGPYQRDAPLIFGDWIKMRKGEVFDFDLVIGERPGGLLGFILQVEEKGRDYRKAPDGRPILPLFTTSPFTDDEKQQITTDLGPYEVDWNEVPVFGIK